MQHLVHILLDAVGGLPVFRTRIIRHKVVVFILCGTGAILLLVLKRVNHLLVFRLQDDPTQLFGIFVPRILLDGVLCYYLCRQVVVAQVRPQVVIQVRAVVFFFCQPVSSSICLYASCAYGLSGNSSTNCVSHCMALRVMS